MCCSRRGWPAPMSVGENAFVASVTQCMCCDQPSVGEYLNLTQGDLDLHFLSAQSIRHAVSVAVIADHPVAADAALDRHDSIEGLLRQSLERLLLGLKGGVDHLVCRAMVPTVGNFRQPLTELAVEIVQIAEGAAQEEVLTDIAIGPLDLTLSLGTISGAGPRCEYVVFGERLQ